MKFGTVALTLTTLFCGTILILLVLGSVVPITYLPRPTMQNGVAVGDFSPQLSIVGLAAFVVGIVLLVTAALSHRAYQARTAGDAAAKGSEREVTDDA